MKYKPTIGLEIHTELKTNSKMFCGCKNDPDEKRPNFNICAVCMAHPGALPVANKEAIKMVIKTGIALNCKINKKSKFDRKNYFYPDLPKGYQISQFDKPLCDKGFLEINKRKIGITRIHLEEDTGSLMHPEDKRYSLVNYNRAGVPLMELVTEPDITSGKEARLFAEELQLILRYLGVSHANMEKGQMRIEVNISLSNTDKFGTKVEIKNLNSFRVVEKAVDFEIARQTELLEKGEKIVQETRGWHDKKEITFSQRKKEESYDYRYFPEPDLPLLNFEDGYIQEIKSQILELPQKKRERFKNQFNLEDVAIEFFIKNKDLSEYYEKVISELEQWVLEQDNKIKISLQESKRLQKLTSNYILSDVIGLLGGIEFIEVEFKITPENFAEFIKMIYKQEISSKVAKMVLSDMINTGSDPSSIVESNNWGQMKNLKELEQIIREVIEKNKKVVDEYKLGKQNALQFLIGKIMATTKGTANPEKAKELLIKILS